MRGRRYLLAAIGLLGGGAGDVASRDVASESFAHPQQLVAIDGARHVNLFCLGEGSPTVLFEAGAGSNGSTWRHVQGQVAAFTRACVYDRAGLGFSDPPGRTVDAVNVVDDLQRLVVAAPLKTPLVLVGHSIGGLYATLFAAMHKDEVAGMVLVDPSFAHQFESFAQQSTQAEISKFYGTFRMMGEQARACRALVRQLAPGQAPNAQQAPCLPASDMPERPDAVLLAALTQQARQPAFYDTMVSEVENFIPTTEGEGHPAPDDNELDSASGNLGAMPLVVLTAGRTMATFPGLDDAERARFASAWMAGHDALAHRSTQGSNVLLANSGHYIQIDQPGEVIAAIGRVVDAARAVAPAP
jgi:pimeloyl-ACP methyl ester carboxylesterase